MLANAIITAIKLIKLQAYAPTLGKNLRSKKNGIRIIPLFMNLKKINIIKNIKILMNI